MSHHLNRRSLTFYSCAVGIVIGLFSVISAYGEANLHAPTYVGGRYPITAPTLPECWQNQSLVLFVQQSGVFLTGSLIALDASEKGTRSVAEHPSLTGRWNNQTLTLRGTATLPNCSLPLRIQGKFEGKTLQGVVQLNSTSGEFPFTATRDVPQEPQSEGGH
ncbi:hypothetical protein ACN4EK_31825 [Pantanalinema rosaneae CENA516]|uniref:hypothetical protein n=1 Tax=Pantanalinema rosaneae TaxID=1620701 RepID=UPI003D6E9DEE